jgi:hypothetical protein
LASSPKGRSTPVFDGLWTLLLNESSLAQLGTEGRVVSVGLWLAPDRAEGVHA